MAAEANHPHPTPGGTPGGTLGRKDTARLLSVGEAADLAQVSHMTLRNAVRAGRMRTVTGRRRGRLLRLVRVEELARVYPEVLDWPLPPSVPVEELPVALSLADDGTAVVAGGEPLEDQASDPSGNDPAEDREPEEGSADYLWAQLDQLRDQVRSTRDHNRRLFDELTESDRAVRELRDGHTHDERVMREAEARLALEREGFETALVGQRRARRLASLSLGAVLLTAGVSSFLLSRQGTTVWAAEPTELTELTKATPAGSTGPVPTVALPTDFSYTEPPLDAEPEVGPHPPTFEAPRAAPEAVSSAAIVPAVFRGPVLAVELPSDASAVEAIVEEAAASTTPVPIGAPVRTVEQPAPAATDDLPCTFHARVRPGSVLRGLLGPCSGDWSLALSAVVGRVRVGGEAYCRQHHLIASTLGGSLERARAEAEFTLSQGMLPPLLGVRIDNAAAAFLLDRAPVWIESGFEAGPAPSHVVTELQAVDAWRVESWVRYRDPGGLDIRRTFRMELVLGDGVAGDVLSSFAWTDL